MLGQSKSETVYAAVRDRILAGEYAPGVRLVLSRVATEFEMSPVPVREAVRRLEAEGLVRYTRNVGAEVLGINTRGYVEAMETVAYLEGVATALAAPQVTTADLAAARRVNAAMQEGLRRLDPVAFSTLNEQFHRVLCRPCPHSRLLGLLCRAWEDLSRVRHSTFIFVPERSGASVQEHARLLDLIESQAPAADIESAARTHKLHTLRALTRYMDDTDAAAG